MGPLKIMCNQTKTYIKLAVKNQPIWNCKTPSYDDSSPIRRLRPKTTTMSQSEIIPEIQNYKRYG